MKHLTVTGLVAGLALLGACGPTADNHAGSALNDWNFGQANTNNMMVQTGRGQFRIDLANRFAKEVQTTVNFAFNSAVLDGEARAAIAQQATWIKQFPEIRFKVYGHTDLVGSNAYNKRLGLRRARAVVSELTRHGISRKRLQAVVSFGETQPLIVTQGRERRNRRTVTEVSGFIKNHPTVLDGKYAQIVYRDYITSAKAESDLRTFDEDFGDQVEE